MSKLALTVVVVLVVSSAGCVGNSIPSSGESVENVTVVSEDPLEVTVEWKSVPTVNGSAAEYVVLTDEETETIDAVLIQNQTRATLKSEQALTNTTRVAFQNANRTRKYIKI